jgi:hypothetical protein
MGLLAPFQGGRRGDETFLAPRHLSCVCPANAQRLTRRVSEALPGGGIPIVGRRSLVSPPPVFAREILKGTRNSQAATRSRLCRT